MEQATTIHRPRFLERVGHFFKGPNPLHPGVWEGRLRPMTFRRLVPADVPQCLELYHLNAPGRFPEGVVTEYEAHLRDESSYFLVAEEEGRIVASGSMSYYAKPRVVIFSYGLVRPEAQGRGVGTALFLARLALLNPREPVYHVFIFAVEKSFVFYQRFGFTPTRAWHDAHGAAHPSGHLIVSIAEAQRCRKLLAAHGISVPHDEDKVPLRMKKEA